MNKEQTILFIEYPSCSTCKRAKKWLEDNNINFTDRNIKIDNPSKKELAEWISKSGLKINKFFNTSGKVYKENNLKEKVAEGNMEELLNILSSDGMVVKRPIIIGGDFVLVGFNKENWTEKLA